MLTADEILTAAAKLSNAERIRIVEALLASTDEESDEDVMEAWRQVALARAAELDSGLAHTVSWESVREEGAKMLRDRQTH